MRSQLFRLTASTLGLCAAVTTVGLAPAAVAHPGPGRHTARHAPSRAVSPRTPVPSSDGPVTANPAYTDIGGYAIAVDSRRGLVYMQDVDQQHVTVYDERTRTATKVPRPVGSGSLDTIDVDQKSGYAYIPGGYNSNQITVLRAGELVGSLTLPTTSTSPSTFDVAVDPVRHLAYVSGGSTVYVLRGAELVASVPVGDGAYTPVVNPADGLVYVPTSGDGDVSVIKGTEVVATVDIGDDAVQAAVDPVTGLVYVTTYGGTVSVLQGDRSEPVATLHTGNETYAAAVNPRTHLVYVTDSHDQTVTVIRGTRIVKTLNVPVSSDKAVAVNPVSGLVLVAGIVRASQGGPVTGAVTGIRGTKVVSTTPTADIAYQPGFDTRTGRAFVTAQNSLLDLQTPAASTITVESPQQGHVYHRGQPATARYSCTAGTDNVLRSCAAWIENGGRLATRRLGRHAFTVVARSVYGPTVRTRVHYRVRR